MPSRVQFLANKNRVSSILDTYFESISNLSDADVKPTLNSDLINLQQVLTELSYDQSFTSALVSNPSLLNHLGIGKDVHVNRLIFRIFVDPVLKHLSLNGDVDLFSMWDHYLFPNHIQVQDTPSWFGEAFWDINRHALGLVERASIVPKRPFSSIDANSFRGPIIIVFKGPPALAHFQNFYDFLASKSVSESSDDIRVVFLDVGSANVPSLPCKVFCLGDQSVKDKIRALHSIVINTRASCLVWVACVQNLGLFLFSRLAPKQAYWSMKYHSITSSAIDLSFRSSTYADCLHIDGHQWFGIPTNFSSISNFINAGTSNLAAISSSNLSIDQAPSHLRCLSLGREIKVSSTEFSAFLEQLLINQKYSFSYSGRKPAGWHEQLAKSVDDCSRLNFLGWLSPTQMKDALFSSDVYIDSFPFGGGHTCFYAMSLLLPVLMIDSDQNRRCSFMMHLLDWKTYFGLTNTLEELGIFSTYNSLLDFLFLIENDPSLLSSKLSRIAQIQKYLFDEWTNSDHYDMNCSLALSRFKPS